MQNESNSKEDESNGSSDSIATATTLDARFVYESEMECEAQDVIAWHQRVGAFERLAPPWMDVKVLERNGGIADGGTVTLQLKKGPFALNWYLAHKDFEEGRQFCDYQIKGPFQKWQQLHKVENIEGGHSMLIDAVNFEPPLAPFGEIGTPIIKSELTRLFRFRHRLLRRDLHLWKRSQRNKVVPLKFLISGSSGLIGRNLIPFLLTQGHSVARLVRPESQRSAIVISGTSETETLVDFPSQNSLENLDAFEGFDVFIHLGGDSVASGFWSEQKKNNMVSSRVETTNVLMEIIAKLRNPPRVLLCASAIGYYGNRGNELLTEASAAGDGFLADLCKRWEAATQSKDLESQKLRVCNLRLGVVLAPAGGALKKLLPPFQMGLGGRLGSGQQYMSWISIDDAISSIYHCAITNSISGPVNLVAPKAVSNAEFSRILGRVLKRPALTPVPEAALRATLGEMADECLLAGSRVVPEKLLQTQFEFRDPNLEDALLNLLGLG